MAAAATRAPRPAEPKPEYRLSGAQKRAAHWGGEKLSGIQPPPSSQGGEAPGLPTVLLGRAQPRGIKGGEGG